MLIHLFIFMFGKDVGTLCISCVETTSQIIPDYSVIITNTATPSTSYNHT